MRISRAPPLAGDRGQAARREAAGWQPGHDIQPLIDVVWTLDGCEDVASLLKLAMPRG